LSIKVESLSSGSEPTNLETILPFTKTIRLNLKRKGEQKRRISEGDIQKTKTWGIVFTPYCSANSLDSSISYTHISTPFSSHNFSKTGPKN
jgi:hypothetical protein